MGAKRKYATCVFTVRLDPNHGTVRLANRVNTHPRDTRKALKRLLLNLEFDMNCCSCAPDDVCPSHEVMRSLELR